MVTPVGLGTATVTVRTGDGSNLSASCIITTLAQIFATSLTLDKDNAVMGVGETMELIAIIEPEDVTVTSVSWTSSDEEIATVDDNGVVTALAPGDVTITATTTDGTQLTASCSITVELYILADWIWLDPESANMYVGEGMQINAYIEPEDVTDSSVTWTSSDEEIATVDESGYVTALAPGDVTITATTNDGSGLSASCDITVELFVPTAALTLDKNSVFMNLGEMIELTALIALPTVGNVVDVKGLTVSVVGEAVTCNGSYREA